MERLFAVIVAICFLFLVGYNIGLEAGHTRAFAQCKADSEKILKDHVANSWLRR